MEFSRGPGSAALTRLGRDDRSSICVTTGRTAQRPLAEGLFDEIALVLAGEEGGRKARRDDGDEDARENGEEEEGDLLVAEEDPHEIIVAIGQAGMGQPVLDQFGPVDDPVEPVRRIQTQRHEHRRGQDEGQK